jgi:hypothetical protein
MGRMRWVVVLGVVLTVGTLAVGAKAGEQPSCATGSVIQLEVARTQHRAVDLIGPCDRAGLDVLRDGLRADTRGFVPLYVLSVGLWSLLGARLTWSTERRRRLVLAAAPAIALAGIFDLIENHLLGHVVDAAGASSAIGSASAASAVKWLLVLYAVPTSVIAMVRCIRAAVRPSTNS